MSWQLEPSGWREDRGLSAALSPWPESHVARRDHRHRSANGYYLSRTSNAGFRTPDHHPGYGGVGPEGRIELQSYVGRARENDQSLFLGHSESAYSHHGISKFGVKHSTEPLAKKDELSFQSVVHHDLGHGHGHDHTWPSASGYAYDEDCDVDDGDDDEDDDGGDDDEGAAKSVGLFGLFKYSTKWDFVLVLLGCLGALINGGSLPWYSYLFGVFVNNIGVDTSEAGKIKMMKDVEKVHTIYVHTHTYVHVVFTIAFV